MLHCQGSQTLHPFSGTVIGSSASAGVQGCQNDSDLDQSGQVGEGGGHGGQGGQRDGQQGGHGQGDQEGQCGQRGRDGQKGRGGRGGYGGDDQGVEPLSPEGGLFRDITSTIILVDSFMTLEKKLRNQKTIIHQAARKFLSSPIVKDLQLKAYDPYEEIMPNDQEKNRILFHGTRRSRLPNFEDHGVAPVWRPNELCSGRAFYVTNSIEQAIAHVPYACPRPPDLDADPIIILVFSIDIPILHGYQPSPDPSITFSIKWFKDDDSEEFFEVCY